MAKHARPSRMLSEAREKYGILGGGVLLLAGLGAILITGIIAVITVAAVMAYVGDNDDEKQAAHDAKTEILLPEFRQWLNVSHTCQAVREADADKTITEAVVLAATTETDFLTFASREVPESMNLPHDRVLPSKAKTVGLYLRRPQSAAEVKMWMNPHDSTMKMIESLREAQRASPDASALDLVVDVQRPAFPDNYARHQERAHKIATSYCI